MRALKRKQQIYISTQYLEQLDTNSKVICINFVMVKYFRLPRNILTSENISIKCKHLGCVTLGVIGAPAMSSHKVRKFHSTTLCAPFR